MRCRIASAKFLGRSDQWGKGDELAPGSEQSERQIDYRIQTLNIEVRQI